MFLLIKHIFAEHTVLLNTYYKRMVKKTYLFLLQFFCWMSFVERLYNVDL